jgi:hypothetical protein
VLGRDRCICLNEQPLPPLEEIEMQGNNWKSAMLLGATLGLMATVPNVAIAQSDISRQQPQGLRDTDSARQQPQGLKDVDQARQQPQGLKDVDQARQQPQGLKDADEARQQPQGLKDAK